jgi:predicted ferric reductase
LSIGALLWHIIIAEGAELRKLVFPLGSASIWLINLIPFLLNLRIRSGEIEISKFYRTHAIERHNYREVDIIRIDIKLKHPIIIKPGQYVYLRVRDSYLSDKIQTHPFMISWWGPAYNINLKNAGSPEAQSLTMLVQPVNGLTRRLGSKTFLQGVSFDGPLGQNLQLERYDNVFLAVKGIGIAGVLSYAKHLVELESSLPGNRRITPRKVDLYWELEDNSQEQWAGPFLRELQLKNDAVLFIPCVFY